MNRVLLFGNRHSTALLSNSSPTSISSAHKSSTRNYLIVYEGDFLHSEALLLVEVLLVLENPLIEELLQLFIAVGGRADGSIINPSIINFRYTI